MQDDERVHPPLTDKEFDRAKKFASMIGAFLDNKKHTNGEVSHALLIQLVSHEMALIMNARNEAPLSTKQARSFAIKVANESLEALAGYFDQAVNQLWPSPTSELEVITREPSQWLN